MDDETTLLPCPFCGGAACAHDERENGAWVGCTSCEAKVGYDLSSMYQETAGDFQDVASAVAAWNRRTPTGCGPIGETE